MGAIGNLGTFVIFVGGCLGQYYSAKQAFVVNGIVPDLVSYPPRCNLGVYFPTGVSARQGNVLCLSQVKEAPSLVWTANPYRYYTIICADPDAPSRINPQERSFLHWIVVNIPGNNLGAGETIYDYLPPTPPPKTGPHRYCFIVYEHSSRICYNGPRDYQNRAKFSVDWFAAQYGLGCPYAGNFYFTQNEDN